MKLFNFLSKKKEPQSTFGDVDRIFRDALGVKQLNPNENFSNLGEIQYSRLLLLRH